MTSSDNDKVISVLIVGAGRGGSALLDMLLDEPMVEMAGIMDSDPDAPGLSFAKRLGIATFTDLNDAIEASKAQMVFNLTGKDTVSRHAVETVGSGAVIGGLEAHLIWTMVTDLKKAKESLLYEATHDALTGLYNRRHLIQQLENETEKALRYQLKLSCVLIDVDHFKQVNDQYGHAAGDNALKHLAGVLREGGRYTDIIGRWGGEEFLAILPHTDGDSAVQAAEKWRKMLLDSPLMLEDGKRLQLNYSAGVASLAGKHDSKQKDVDRLLAAADNRLYHAKEAGRGRVEGPAQI